MYNVQCTLTRRSVSNARKKVPSQTAKLSSYSKLQNNHQEITNNGRLLLRKHKHTDSKQNIFKRLSRELLAARWYDLGLSISLTSNLGQQPFFSFMFYALYTFTLYYACSCPDGNPNGRRKGKEGNGGGGKKQEVNINPLMYTMYSSNLPLNIIFTPVALAIWAGFHSLQKHNTCA